MVLTIDLLGRITGENAELIENNIFQQITNDVDGIIFDAQKLDYISSAGLKIVLKMKKAYANTTVINCNPFVYDIFAMTGFTEMMDITKS